MFYDYHLHCNFSHDSKAHMEDMVKKAIDLQIKEMCFTDHTDYSVLLNNKEIDYEFNVKDYFNSINNLKELYKDKIIIKKGIEVGIQSHILDRCSNLILENDFDFVIASIHTIDKYELIHRNLYKGKTQEEAYRKYYETLYEMLKKYKDYSVVGHLDIVKRYGDLKNIVDDKVFKDIIDETLKLIIADGKGIEINTSSFRYKLTDLTPSRYILKRYRELGGEIITTGSDAHVDYHLAYNFYIIYNSLKELGYKYICTFDEMKPNFIKI